MATNSSGAPLSNSAPTSGYYPADLQSAYQLPGGTAGVGETVGVVDAYNDPNAAADLAVYRSQFDLPTCTTTNGCLRVVNQTGGTTLPANNSGWAQEISVDLDSVSAVCPNCHIVLVEANSSSGSDLGTAVDEAAVLGADVISNSYGTSETAGELSDDAFYNHPGIAVTASSGDSGYGTLYPAASPYVTAVGGTTLTKDSSTPRGWTETAWSGAGSGCSLYEPKPSWQTDTGCGKRTIADVSADADPNTGIAVYDSYDQSSAWLVFGGTSVSNAIIAAVYALGGNTTSLNYGSHLYSNTAWLNNVTSGSNGSCGGSYLCTAGPGYNGPTGLGTPAGVVAFGGSPSNPTVTSVSPSSGPSTGGTVVTVTGTGFVAGSTFDVDFGNSPASSVSLVSPGQLSATSPAGSLGTVDITVTTPAGTSTTSAADQFTFVTPPAPTVTGVSPTSGSTGGGTPVMLTGTGFTGATTVDFGTKAGTGLVVNSPTSISITSPAESAGTVDITVTTPGGGTSAANPPNDQFTFVTPTASISAVGSFTSKTGSITTMAVTTQHLGDVFVVFAQRASGTTLTAMSGGGVTTWHKAVQFTGSVGADEELWYGTITSTGSSTITFTWSTSITGHTAEYGAQEFTAGLGASTVWSLDKTGTLNGASGTSIPFPSLTPSGTGELYFGYTVPNDTAVAGSTTGFSYTVTPEDNIATYDTTVSGTVAPTASQSPASTSSSVALLLVASSGAPPPAPTVTGVSPSSGSTGGGTPVMLTGTGFTGATTVDFGTKAGTGLVVNSPTSISITSPAESAGTVDITVTTPGGGTSAANPPNDQFTFVTPPAPTVTGVSPTSGSTGGGTPVMLTGTGFTGATTVDFGTKAGTGLVVNSPTSISITSPAESAGTVDITVTTPGGGTSAANPPNDQFTFVTPPAPTVTGVSPTSGSTGGGTPVMLTGTGFTGATTVDFGTKAGTGLVVNSPTSISITSPAESAGTVDITVTTPGGGTSAANPPNDQFTFVTPPAPTVTGVSPTSGSTGGGTPVMLTGTGFTGATTVDFGTKAGTGLVVNSPTSISITSPAESAGTVDITVTTPGGGTSAANPPNDQFTFVTPTTSISAVGSFSSKTGSITTMAVTTQHLGDVFVVFAQRASGTTLTAMSGGGVTTWHKAVQFTGSVGADDELWYGTITSTGSSTITFTWSTSITGHTAEYGAQEFTAGLGASTVWSLDKTGTLNGASGTSIPFPSLTPTGTGELYFGYTVPNDTAVAGSTTGFAYTVTPEDNIATYDTTVSGTVAPTASQSPASTSSSVALLLTASS